MPKENNKVDINKHEIDIDTLFKQNVNDLSAIKELYRKLKEMENKISQIKYIDSNLANKLKKDYESLKKAISEDYESLKCVILEENIQAKLADDIKTINSQLDTKPNFDTNDDIAVSRIGRLINKGMSNPQGFCFDGEYYYCIYRLYNGTGDDTSAKLVKYNTSFNIVKEVILNLGHGNSICKVNNNLYITDITDKIFKVNSESLMIEDTIVFKHNITAISKYEDNYYLLGDSCIYKTRDFIDYEIINLSLPVNEGASQGMEVYDGYIYILWTSPNTIIQFDLDGSLKYIFRLPLFADRVFRIGEVEDLTIINDNIYFNSVILDPYNETETNSIFIANLKNNIAGISHQKFLELNKIKDGYQIFVDNTNKNVNPVGTFSNPFKTLNEAIEFVSNPYVGNCQLTIKKETTQLDENIYFRGMLNNIYIIAQSPCKIKNLTLGRCNATLTNLLCSSVVLQNSNVVANIFYEDLTAYYSSLTLFGGNLDVTKQVILNSSTLQGVADMNVSINDFGCHGVFKIIKTINIGESYTSTLVSKAKIIYVTISNNSKIYTCQLTKDGINQLNTINVYDGSAGAMFSTFHVNKNGDTLSFNDVRNIDLDKVATTINTSNKNFIITELTFIL